MPPISRTPDVGRIPRGHSSMSTRTLHCRYDMDGSRLRGCSSGRCLLTPHATLLNAFGHCAPSTVNQHGTDARGRYAVRFVHPDQRALLVPRRQSNGINHSAVEVGHTIMCSLTARCSDAGQPGSGRGILRTAAELCRCKCAFHPASEVSAGR